MTIESTIVHAIKRRLIVTCLYNKYPRSILPLVLYGNRQTGLTLYALQTAGSSASGQGFPAWKNFDLSKIENVKTSKASFKPSLLPADYDPENFQDRITFVPKA